MLPPPKRSPATEHPKGVVYRRVKKRKLLPGWAVFLIDFGLIGVTVCIFALFHHVLPRKSNNPGVVIPPPGVSSTVSDASGNPVSRPDTSGAPDTGGQFGAKFADKFSDTVQKTDSSYVSKDIRVTLTKHTTNRERNGRSYVVTYFVADIYIRNIENFRTAFAQGEYGHGYRDNTVTMAKDNHAVVALSGDYYSIRDTGVVIRNGMLYREQAFRDVCVLYRDGSMRTYSKETFDINEAVAGSAWQAWSFGPRLLENGQPMTNAQFDTDVYKANPRSALGYYEPGHYAFVLVDGRQEGYSTGMTLEELSQLFYDMGCQEAYNLDGGQSAVMAFDGELANQPYGGGRNISDILYIGEVE